MSETKPGNTIARKEVEDLCRINGEPTWLQENRLAGWEAYLQCPMPTVKDDDWRTTMVDKLDLCKLSAVTATTPGATLDELDLPLLESSRQSIPSIAGIYAEDYVTGKSALQIEQGLKDKGVIFTSLKEALASDEKTLKAIFAGQSVIGEATTTAQVDKFSLMNQALWTDGLYLRVPKNVTVEAPFVVMVNLPVKDEAITSDNAGQAVFPRVVIVAEENSKVDIVTITSSQKSTAIDGRITLANANIEIQVGAGARVSVADVTSCASEVFMVNRVRTAIDRDGALDYTTAGLGAGQVKSDIESILAARGSRTDVKGVVLGKSEERFSYNTIADHSASDATSNIIFRVALKDKATSIYQGIVKVDEKAQRTDAYQSNKNLLLSEGARADSIPKLEILADDVKCSHGATVGPVDREQLFYLNCRGLTEAEAEELVVTGFFQQVLDTIPISGVSQWMADLVAEKIHENQPG